MFFCDDNADWLREHAGSWWSVWLHTVSFLLSFNLGLDINLLTVIVSLEAVFLCIFLLMSCNRQGEVTGTRLRRTTALTSKQRRMSRGLGKCQPLAAVFGLGQRRGTRYFDQRQGSRVSIWRIGWSAMRLSTSAR